MELSPSCRNFFRTVSSDKWLFFSVANVATCVSLLSLSSSFLVILTAVNFCKFRNSIPERPKFVQGFRPALNRDLKIYCLLHMSYKICILLVRQFFFFPDKNAYLSYLRKQTNFNFANCFKPPKKRKERGGEEKKKKQLLF